MKKSNLTRVDRELSLSDPVIGEDECVALKEVIQSGWITMGEMVSRFEREFAQVHECEHAVAVSSATAGLHLSLAALGVGSGDEVLVPSLTFVATANAAWYVGATPVFVDIESVERPQIDLNDARRKLSSRTKAIVIVHYGGWLCPVDQWRTFASEHGLFILEDAAHVSGLNGAGKSGDAAIFSFYGNKNMTTAEGGMVLVGNEELALTIRRLRSHGMTSQTLDRYEGHAFTYDVTDLGYNYRMDDLRAALGLVQLGKLSSFNKLRANLLKQYRDELLLKASDVNVPFDKNEETTGHLCPVVLPRQAPREDIMLRLRKMGIHSSIHYPPVHRFTYYENKLGVQNLPQTDEYARHELSLPLHPGLSRSDVIYIVDRLVESLGS